MSKSRRAFLHELPKPGTAAVAGSAVRVSSLNKLAANTGVLNIGLLIAGNTGGVHTIIGGSDGGIQMYSEPNRLVVYLSPLNGGRFRLGALDQPGITMAAGSVHIEGDCIVDGTLTTSKLQVGEFARVLLEDNEIRVGEMAGALFTGWRVSQTEMGGFRDSVPVWRVDNETGEIVTGRWPASGVGLGDNHLTLSTFTDVQGGIDYGSIFFKQYREESGEYILTVSGELAWVAGALHLRNTAAVIMYQANNLEPYTDDFFVSLTTYSLDFTPNGTRLYHNDAFGSLSVRDGQYIELGVRTVDGSQVRGISIDGLNVSFNGVGLTLPRRFAPAGNELEGAIYYDFDEKTVKVLTDTGWKVLAYAA